MHLLVDIWIVSTVWVLLWIVLLWTYIYMDSFGYLFSVLRVYSRRSVGSYSTSMLSYTLRKKLPKCFSQQLNHFTLLPVTYKGSHFFTVINTFCFFLSHCHTQLHSSHTLAKYCSKFSKWGFNSRWTKNFHMFKLDLEKAEEPERSNCKHPLDHR